MAELAVQNKISQTSQGKKRYATNFVMYDDGYQQRARDGINRERESWQIQWSNLTQAEMNTLYAFIDSVEMTDYFTWNPVGEDYLGSPIPTKKWVFDPESEITVINKTGNFYDVSATIRRVYDL